MPLLPLVSLNARAASPQRLGGKGHHLHWMLNEGLKVPDTWGLSVDADVPTEVELAAALEGAGPWAVRSSAIGEDGDSASWAGQFATYLDVASHADVVAAIAAVRASVNSETAVAYRTHIGVSVAPAMGVIVQRMVRPVVSGVAFSRNPITGLNEVVIEAIEGRGDALVGEGRTPERWIERWGAWSERPEDPVLPDAVAADVAERTKAIAEDFGGPADLEWVWDGSEVWWVQVRPITGIEDVGVYSNRISKEVLPGMIKPLVWSVNIPIVNAAWIRLFTDFIGPNRLRPEDLATPFAYRAYFNMAAIGDIFETLGFPRDGLEMLLGLPSRAKPRYRPGFATIRHVPRMLAASVRLLRYGRRVERDVDEFTRRYESIEMDDLTSMEDRALLERITEVAAITIDAAYSNIVTPILANAWTWMLRRLLAREVDDADSLDLDLTDPDNPFDPTPGLADLNESIAAVDGLSESLAGPEGLPADLRARFDRFLDRFGALSDSGNDFSVPSWNEQPGHVLALAMQHADVSGSGAATPWREATRRTGALRRWILGRVHASARTFVAHRESVSFTYTVGYGMLRPLYLEVGRRLVERGELQEPDDVMFLTVEETTDALLGRTSGAGEISQARREDMVRLRDVRMPETIFGDDFVPVPHSDDDVGEVTGVATSRGWHRGTLRVVNGIADGPRVQPGDVIAVPFSDVGWTPIFAKAGAVIAESGGMLSHSSIVAREYQVPCVVQVADATRLPDGATVVVDGYTGTVTVESIPQQS